MKNQKVFSFDQLLATHTAPTLLGIKSANLFSFPKSSEENLNEKVDEFNQKAEIKGLKMLILCECNKKALVFVYREKLLDTQLNITESAEILELAGYEKSLSIQEKLDILSRRITNSESFPHEIGLFLDYPVHDVKGFIENEGKNYKFFEYWKVYDQEDFTRKRFNNFTKCRCHLQSRLEQGLTIFEALKIA